MYETLVLIEDTDLVGTDWNINWSNSIFIYFPSALEHLFKHNFHMFLFLITIRFVCYQLTSGLRS